MKPRTLLRFASLVALSQNHPGGIRALAKALAWENCHEVPACLDHQGLLTTAFGVRILHCPRRLKTSFDVAFSARLDTSASAGLEMSS